MDHNAFSIFPCDPAGANDLFKKLKAAGKIVVAYGAEPNLPTPAAFTVATDIKLAAMVATERLIELMGKKGNILNILETATDINTQKRNDGIKAVVTKYPNVKIIQTISDMVRISQAKEKIAQTIAARGGMVDGIITTGYNPTVAAVAVLTQWHKDPAHKRIRFVGIDTAPAVLKAIGNGSVDATVAQNVFGHGYVSTAILEMMLDGWKPVKEYQFIDSGTVVVTKANLDTYRQELRKLTSDIVSRLKAGSLTPPTPIGKLELKISRRLQNGNWSDVDKAYVRGLWQEFQDAWYAKARSMNHSRRADLQPDVRGCHIYIGQYNCVRGQQKDKNDKLLEVRLDSDGRFIVTLEGHEMPAIARNGSLLFTTGDVVHSRIPTVGAKPHATLEYLLIARVGGQYYLTQPGLTMDRATKLTPATSAGSEPATATQPADAKGTLELLVVDKKTGKGIKGVQLVVTTPRVFAQSPRLCVTDTNGHCVVKGLPAGPANILLGNCPRRMDWIQDTPMTVKIASRRVTKDVKIELVRGAVIKVDVVDENGKPMVGARILGINTEGRRVCFNGLTDPNGRARMRARTGEYDLRFDHGYRHGRTTLKAEAGVDQKISFKFKAPTGLSGTVVGPNGEPVAGARVLLPEWITSRTMASTDGEGKFEIPPKLMAVLYEGLSCPPLLVRDRTGALAAFLKTEGATSPVAVKLAPTVTFVGNVTYSDSRPLPLVSVACTIRYGKYPSDYTYLAAPTKTDNDGRYEIKGVIPGLKYSMETYIQGYGQGRWPAFRLAKDVADKVEVGNMALRPADESLAGIAVDKDGDPVPNARVRVETRDSFATTTTDADGRFTVEHITTGTAKVTARALYLMGHDYAQGSIVAKAGDTNVRVVLGRDGSAPK